MIVAAAWALVIWLVILLAFGPDALKVIAAKRARSARRPPNSRK